MHLFNVFLNNIFYTAVWHGDDSIKMTAIEREIKVRACPFGRKSI